MSEQAGRAENAMNAIWRFIMRLAIIALVIFAFYRLRNVVTTLFVAAIIAYVLEWPIDWLCRRQGFLRFHMALATGMAGIQAAIRRTIFHQETAPPERVRMHRHGLRVYATLYVMIIAAVALWKGTGIVVQPFVREFTAATQKDPTTGKSPLQRSWEKGLHRYDKIPNLPEPLKSDKLMTRIQASNVQEFAQKYAAELAPHVVESLKNVVEIVILPVLAFYFLIDGRKLKHEFVPLVPRKHLHEAVRMLNEFNRIMRAFIVGQFILCLLAGVIVGFGLLLLGVQFPMTLGVLAGITRAIPIIGPIIGGIPIILLAWATKGPGVALAVLGFFTFMHFAESKFIMPMLIGDRMELHPVIILLVLLVGGEVGALVIGGSLGGLLGMFFAA
ncbi:MAG TPA: AI-2E family transporter, partial [Chthonomonadaceae bacterium]|nr:AI-2E family transporter [Chthonomonadaceae bacterium]